MKTKLILATLLLAFCSFTVCAQQSDKTLKKDLKAKVDKDCRKEAKVLKKEGWQVMTGNLPLEKQLQEARYAQLDTNVETGEKMYFTASHQSLGGNYSAAKQIADSRAMAELAQQVNASVAKKVTEQISNLNLGENDIELVDEMVSANKSVVAASLQGTHPVLEIYREAGHGKYEVRVMVTINAEQALKSTKAGLISAIKEKSEKLAQDLDAVLPY